MGKYLSVKKFSLSNSVLRKGWTCLKVSTREGWVGKGWTWAKLVVWRRKWCYKYPGNWGLLDSVPVVRHGIFPCNSFGLARNSRLGQLWSKYGASPSNLNCEPCRCGVLADAWHSILDDSVLSTGTVSMFPILEHNFSSMKQVDTRRKYLLHERLPLWYGGTRKGHTVPYSAVEGRQARRAGNCKPVEPPGDVKFHPVFILD